MSTAAGALRPPPAHGVSGLLRSVAEAVGSLSRREWATALAVGLAFGLAEALRCFVTHGDTLSTWRLDLAMRIVATFMVEMALASALLAVGLRWLDRRSGERPSFAAQAAVIGGVSLLVAAACAEPLREAIVTLQGSVGLEPLESAPTSPNHWENLLCMAFGLAMYVLLWTLICRFLQRGRRSAEQLAVAQARGIDAERRALAEQLAGAQAMIEPAFLFDTLQLADRLFDRDAALAQKMLMELHRYLRAAMPPADGSISTLGQQAELLRARLAIEAIRLDGRLAARIEVQSALAACPLAPMLLLPLTTNAVRHAIEPDGGGEIVVRASGEQGRLHIEIADSGAGRAAAIRDGAGLGALRERLVALYGEHASLVFADREPRGVTACIEIDDGGFA
jgi:hypothetical protein